jgi:biopolymer transport protein ExbB/TolQ
MEGTPDRPGEMSVHGIEEVIFKVAAALRVPVLIATLAALAIVIIDAGYLAMEVWRRRGHSYEKLDAAATRARKALVNGDRSSASSALRPVCYSGSMYAAAELLVGTYGEASGSQRASKVLADFDYRSLRRLERSRLLVRAGPALGLMGTLIPLAPALAALAAGDVAVLAVNLRVAFSVTILGLLVGAGAFGISLVRDRLYSQDLSDLEYVAVMLGEDSG